VSSDPEEQVLIIDYDFAQKQYQSLLAKKAEADLTVIMNNSAVGERMFPCRRRICRTLHRFQIACYLQR